MLGLTDRDRQEIRTGRNRQIGARHATLLFWGPIWGRLALAAAAAAAAIFLLVKVHDLWIGGLDQTVTEDWPLGMLGLLFLALFVGLARPRSPRRRRSRHRRRHR